MASDQPDTAAWSVTVNLPGSLTENEAFAAYLTVLAAVEKGHKISSCSLKREVPSD